MTLFEQLQQWPLRQGPYFGFEGLFYFWGSCFLRSILTITLELGCSNALKQRWHSIILFPIILCLLPHWWTRTCWGHRKSRKGRGVMEAGGIAGTGESSRTWEFDSRGSHAASGVTVVCGGMKGPKWLERRGWIACKIFYKSLEQND
jgi:hypothetical protein